MIHQFVRNSKVDVGSVERHSLDLMQLRSSVRESIVLGFLEKQKNKKLNDSWNFKL